MSNWTADATKPDPSLGLRTALYQPVRRGPLIGVDFEVFRFGIDGDVLVGLFFNVDLGTDDPFKDFIRPLGTSRLLFGHGLRNRLFEETWESSYAGGLVSFRSDSNGTEDDN